MAFLFFSTHTYVNTHAHKHTHIFAKYHLLMASANHVQNFSVEEQTINLSGVRAGLELSKQASSTKKYRAERKRKVDGKEKLANYYLILCCGSGETLTLPNAMKNVHE